MHYLFNLVYLLLLVAGTPWFLFAAIRYRKYRDGWGEKFFGRVPRRSGDHPCIWLHAVSVGEVNLLRPVIGQLQKDLPTCECVISTTTRTGFALAQKQFASHTVFYCPLDFSWAVREAMARVRPDLLVLAELELWPNLIWAARRAGARVAVINGRLSDGSFRGYRRIRSVIRRTLRNVDLIAVQNPQYARRFQLLGADRESVQVTGSVKFDGAETDRDNHQTRQLRQRWGVPPGSPVFLAGSTQEPEEQLAVDAYREVVKVDPRWRLILVPRHPERFDEVAAMLDANRLPWERRSQLDESLPRSPTPVLLVDVVGELGGWWGMATVGFVGGSLGPRGGQNMIEPSAYGVAVCYGPKTSNFRDIVALLASRNAAEVVQDGCEMTDFLLRCARSPDLVDRLGRNARETVLSQQGAVRRTVQHLLPLVRPDLEKRLRQVA